MKVWSSVSKRRIAAAATILGGLLGVVSATQALEQPPQYPIGVGTIYDNFYAPVPGMTGYLYQLNINDNVFKDLNGNNAVKNFNLGINALAARVVNVWDGQFLGAKPISWVAMPMAYVNGRIDLGGATIGNDDILIGDMSIAQGLSWHFGPNWSAQASLEIFLPTGPYSTSRVFNFGANVVSFYPNAGVTYWNHETNDTFTAKLQYIMSTENKATHYQNGNSVEMDWGIGIGLGRFGLNKNIGIDLVGFALIETGEDSGPGAAGSPTKKTQLFGVGPQFRYNFEHGGFAIKWEHEFGAKGIGEGERLWAQTAFPLSFGPKPIEREPISERQPLK